MCYTSSQKHQDYSIYTTQTIKSNDYHQPFDKQCIRVTINQNDLTHSFSPLFHQTCFSFVQEANQSLFQFQLVQPPAHVCLLEYANVSHSVQLHTMSKRAFLNTLRVHGRMVPGLGG
jgi:hypothetical protein